MELPFIVQILMSALLGLCLGSFATALIFRVPRGLSWIGGRKPAGGFDPVRSRCPHCQIVLDARDLVPVFSWLFLRGRCRRCGGAIGLRYLLVELFVLAACLGIFAVWGVTLPALIAMVAMPFLAALLVIDLDHMILPDQMNIILAALGLAFQFSLGTAVDGLIGAAVFGGFLWLTGALVGRVLKKEALGLGDVKFAAAAGLWLGAAALPFFLIMAGVAGILWGLGWRFVTGNKLFPFGPSLILAFYVVLLCRGAELFGSVYFPFAFIG